MQREMPRGREKGPDLSLNELLERGWESQVGLGRGTKVPARQVAAGSSAPSGYQRVHSMELS